MSRRLIARLLLVTSILGTMAACGTSPTAPNGPVKTHDTIPWS
jgi:hypothetical protein